MTPQIPFHLHISFFSLFLLIIIICFFIEKCFEKEKTSRYIFKLSSFPLGSIKISKIFDNTDQPYGMLLTITVRGESIRTSNSEVQTQRDIISRCVQCKILRITSVIWVLEFHSEGPCLMQLLLLGKEQQQPNIVTAKLGTAAIETAELETA